MFFTGHEFHYTQKCYEKPEPAAGTSTHLRSVSTTRQMPIGRLFSLSLLMLMGFACVGASHAPPNHCTHLKRTFFSFCLNSISNRSKTSRRPRSGGMSLIIAHAICASNSRSPMSILTFLTMILWRQYRVGPWAYLWCDFPGYFL